MATNKTTPGHISQAGQNLLRILIASYFIAVPIGLISGTDATPLAGVFLSPEPAALIGRSVFFILGYLVLTGIWLRPAAMLLGITMFWSSFVLHFGPNATAPLGDFWRDLVMVAALMLTYTHLSVRGLRRSSMIRNVPATRPVKSDTQIAPRRVMSVQGANVTRLPVAGTDTTGGDQIENIFRDDLQEMLAS